MIKEIQIKLLIIAMIITIGGCSQIEEALLKDQIKRERLARCYIFEVYQNGIKVDEVCFNFLESFSDDNVYYKKKNKLCTEQRDL